MLRLSDGQLLGRPGGPAKYLLTGLLKCGWCGGSFEALSSQHGRRRAFVYGCATHRRKGATICPNDLTVPMEEADVAVLCSVEDILLDSQVLNRAIDRAMALLSRNQGADRRAELEKERHGRASDLTPDGRDCGWRGAVVLANCPTDSRTTAG